MKQKPVHTAMQPFLEGQVILINKPLRWTSFDAVKKVRILTGVSKVGHAGTLDPLATGLLIICTGKFTKKINGYMGMEKEYTGSITLGACTPTFDLESEPENIQSTENITAEKLLITAEKFTGNIMQVPPIHSAIKKDGKKLYELARKGKEVIAEPRPVTISVFELTKIEMPVVYFRVVCSTGTYIRSLANDFGATLGCGGYLSSLCRTKIGDFSVGDAYTLETFEQYIQYLKRSSEGQANT
ncbi:tRNA pseudouridine(55) synthase TruB [Panacibacter ginsenosidivorans]|nr:tRNA pseudouridine(55) synthase TruB [Panacibacter ginsenosidivorans]